MGFSSGLPLLLTASTLSIWLTKAGISLTAIGLFSLVSTPYSLKFIWAPFIDRVRLPLLVDLLGRRRAWMLLFQVGLLLSVSLLGSSRPEVAPTATAVAALCVAFLSASQDVVIDAYRIDILDEDQQGAGAAMIQAGYRFGTLAAGAGALYLSTVYAWSVVYLIMAGLMLVGLVTTLVAPIPSSDRVDRHPPAVEESWFHETILAPFLEFFQRNRLTVALFVLGFILLYKFGDAFAHVMANPFYVKIGFSNDEIATVTKVFGVIATVVGTFMGGIVVKRFGILRSLFVAGIVQMFSNLMFSVQASVGPNVNFLYLTIGIEYLAGGMAAAAFVAYLSALCDASYTGTQYALFTSFMALGRTWLSASSGWIASKTSWVLFFILSTFIALPGVLLVLVMMRFLPLERQRPTP